MKNEIARVSEDRCPFTWASGGWVEGKLHRIQCSLVLGHKGGPPSLPAGTIRHEYERKIPGAANGIGETASFDEPPPRSSQPCDLVRAAATNIGVEHPAPMVLDERLNAYVNPEGHYVIKNGADYLGILAAGMDIAAFGAMAVTAVPGMKVFWTADRKVASEWHAGGPDRMIIKNHDGSVAAGWCGDVVSLFLIMREHGGHLVWVKRAKARALKAA